MNKRLTIIGGGPGGYTAAFSAARAGLDVTLIESDHLGGTCLNYGCVPTKTLRASADALETARHFVTFGIDGGSDVAVNPVAVRARKRQVIATLQGGLEKACAALKINLVRGRGRIVDAKHVLATLTDGASQSIETDAIIIATGSKVLEIPGLTVDHEYILSSDDMLELDRIPESLIVVGGGVVGCELAMIYHAFGAKVTIVEGASRLLGIPSVDNDVSTLLQRELKKRRIPCELGRTLKDVRIEGGMVHATLAPSPFITNHTASQLKEVPTSASMVLVAVGRSANNEGLGLSEAGVNTDARGWILANDALETSLEGVYAIGDILGPSRIMLAHVAAMEGLCAVRNILNPDNKEAMDYAVVPSGIFTAPEVGCVGLSEAQAKEQGFSVKTSVFQMRELGKAQAMNELPGFFKIIADTETDKVLGVHIVGAHATDLIAEATLGIQMGATVQDIAKTIHAHPTLAEGLFEAALHYTH